MKRIFCIGLVLSLALLLFCGCGKKNEYNIFTEFATIEENFISPRYVAFGKTLDTYMQENELTKEDVFRYDDRRADRYISLEYKAENIPYEVRQIVYFVAENHEDYKNQLYKVSYMLSVKKTESETAFESFYEQAKAVMPAPSSQSIENIKTGDTVSWTDQEGNVLTFSTSTMGEENIAVFISIRSGQYPTYADLK